MPLGHLKTTTFYGTEEINSDDLNRKDYLNNQQMSGAKTPIIEPLPKKKAPKAKKTVYKKTDDEALLKANKKDLTNKNIK